MIKYRKATENDISELVRLRIEFLKEANEKQNIDADIKKETENLLYTYFKENLSSRKFIAWISISKGNIIATSGLYFYNIPPLFKKINGNVETVSGNIAYIMNMYTAPDYRNRGIAKLLFEKVLEEAKCLGYKKICLHATDVEQNLYKKYGFELTNSEMELNI